MSQAKVQGGGAEGAAEFEALALEVRTRMDFLLDHWLRPRVAAAAQISPEVGLAAEAVQALTLRGGKRLRAALVAVGFAAHGSAPTWSPCESAMVAVELLQTYLLIHDDWMDGDELRRGGPSVHAQLREQLGTPALADAAAILAGDLASAYAQEALLETALAPERVLRAARVFARTQVDVVSGQIAEMCAARTDRDAPPPPSIEAVYALKTASYTVKGPLLLGAALAGADEARATALGRFARPLGIAFQLRDDLLGLFGDTAETGKPVWSDLRQGKRTALIAELRAHPDADALLERAHGRPEATDEELEAMVRAIEESGARARVEARVTELCGEARQALDAMAPWISKTGRAWLAGAIAALGERSS